MSASIGTSSSSIRGSTDIFDYGSGYIIIRRSTTLLGWKLYVCSNYRMFLVEDANANLLQISSAIILCIRLESAVCKAIFLVADYFNVEVLISSRFMNFHIDTIRCIDRHVEITRGKIQLLESAMDEPTVTELE